MTSDTIDRRPFARGRRHAAVFAGALVVMALPGLIGAAGPTIAIQDQIGLGNRDGAIALQPGCPLRVEKLLVSDCRVGRAFIGYPVDGRLDTRDYVGTLAEYPLSWTGTNYELNDSNGLHIALAGDGGFDALLIRGGYVGKMYRDAGPFEPGDKAVEVCDIASRNGVFRKVFPQRAPLTRLDFFFAKRSEAGLFADGQFLRIQPKATGDCPDLRGAARENETVPFGRTNSPRVAGERLSSDGTVTCHVAEPGQVPAGMVSWMQARFGEGQRVYQAGQTPGKSLELRAGQFVHFLTPQQSPDFGIAAIALKFHVRDIAAGGLVTLRIQDPLDRRRELMGVDFTLPGPGDYEVILDIPDQVFLPPQVADSSLMLRGPLAPPPQFWISMASDVTATVDGLAISLHRATRNAALPQAMAWRKLLLKGQFCMMSEPRPWGGLPHDSRDMRQWLKGLEQGSSARFVAGLEELLDTLEICRLLDPEDGIVRQYYEWIYRRALPPAKQAARLPDQPGTPRWALLVHEGYLAARQIPAWWLANRLAPSGELGCYVCDDVDMFQEWTAVPMIEDAPLGAMIREAAGKLGDMAMARHLREGLNRSTTDPLHAYEEGMNHLSLCAWWFYGDPVHFERVMASARSVPKLTVVGGDGRRHFHGKMVGAGDLDKMGPVDVDGPDHPLLLHPLYEVAWYNRNPQALEFLGDWADTWIGHQKPGQWATAVDVKTGKVVQSRRDMPGLGGYRSQGYAWLGLYHVTGDERFLKPFFMAMDASNYRFLWLQPTDYVTLPAFQERLRKHPEAMASRGGYGGFYLTGDRKLLEAGLLEGILEMQRFPHMYTAAEPFTDRVFLEAMEPVFACYLGSFPHRNRWVQLHAVSYEGFGSDFAALVGLIRPDALRVTMYNFAGRDLAGRMRVWRLDHGTYRVRIGPDADDDGKIDSVAVQRTQELCRYAPLEITLPARRQAIVEIEQTQKLDDIRDRADLAISPLDTQRNKENALVVQVHNIGARSAENVEVAMFRQGRKIASQSIARLDAPLDLMPRVQKLVFAGAADGDEIAVDPDNAVPEIAEHNNRLRLGGPLTGQRSTRSPPAR